MTVQEKLLRSGKGCSAAAFAVFDTLLRRDASTPAALFALSGFSEDFALRRIRAEQEARTAAKGGVTLAEIYARPGMQGEDPARELDAELAACVPDRTMLETARAFHERGLAVYAVSDSCLPKEQLEAMLQKCGADFWDGVFVSSEAGDRKADGALYRRLLRQTGHKPSRVLAAGSDWRRDCLGAALAGMRFVCHPQPALPVYLSGGELQTFARNRQSTPLFETLGPLVTAFAQWIWEQRQAAPGARLLFLARDMELVFRVYHRLFPQDTCSGYLRVSRRSLCPALLAAGQFELAADALPRQMLTAGQIARYCGADIPDQASRVFSLSGGRTPEVVEFLRTLSIDEFAAARTLRYLREQGVEEGTILVDIGGGGTTQRLLEGLCSVRMQGLYLAADERLQRARARVFLFDGKPAPRFYREVQPILEKLISEPCGPTLGYREENGEVFPLCGTASEDAAAANAHQETLRFAGDWSRSILYGSRLTPDQAVLPFLRMMQKPRMAEAVLLGNLMLEDADSRAAPAARPGRTGFYLLRPGQFRKDLDAACWKIGFLRRALLLPLPYHRLFGLPDVPGAGR